MAMEKKPTVLVVDDSLDMRVYIKTILKDFDILEAKNGIEALEILKTHKINLLISDYLMPKMNGIELLKEIRKIDFKFPIIIITVTNQEQEKLEMFRLGIDNYIYKPFFKEELINVVNRALVYHKTLLTESNLKKSTIFSEDVTSFKSKLEAFIYNNVDNFDFSIVDIADEFGISPKTLTRRTKHIYGQTPNQLMIECRLLIANEIMNKNPSLTLKEVAYKVGLKNTTYLKNRLSQRFLNS